MKKLLKITAFSLITIITLAAGAAIWFFAITKDVTFDRKKLENPMNLCKILYSDGEEIKGVNDKEYVAIEDVPDHVKEAFIAIEDKRFYEHGGIDIKAILRALKNNIFAGKIKEGASTISQQLVKNVFLSGEKTVKRKMKEIKLTYALESSYTKNEILEKYLNTIYFGYGCYGLANAAKKYFAKEVKDLDIDEGAALAAIVKAPSLYNPIDNREKCLERRNVVLRELKNQRYIDVATEKQLKIKELSVNTDALTKETDSTLRNWIISDAITLLGAESAEELGGYVIKTTVDKALCKKINPKVAPNDVDYTAMIVDNKTGNTVGLKSTTGQLKRCPASTVKPCLIYAPAIEYGKITEATKILDKRTDFGGYSPSNYADKYYGYVSVKDALAKSLNVPAVKIAENIGLETIVKHAKKLGITVKNRDLSVALGNISGGLSISDIARAYIPFTNGGNVKNVSIINEIVSPKGNVVYKNRREEKRIISPATSYIITDILKESVKSGTAKKLDGFDFEVCAKTGTSGNENGNTDAYCIAYTTDHTVIVWMGKTDSSLMPNEITGSSYPCVMAKQILSDIYKNHRPSDFTAPQSVKLIPLNKCEYEKNSKLIPDKDGKTSPIKFWFTVGTEPKDIYAKQTTPRIKHCKITYINGKILIYIHPDACRYKVYCNGAETYDGVGEYTLCLPCAKPDEEYSFTITPYVLNGNRFISGNTIKLPSVKTDGISDLKKTDWWQD